MNIRFFNDLKQKHNFKSISFWFEIIGLIIYTITVIFTIINFIYYSKTAAWKVFFGIFDRFTYQSNWLLFFFTLIHFIKPDHQIFKGNKFLVTTMVYIFFTFFGYNIVLVLISGDRGYFGDAYDITSNFWLHLLSPLWFIAYGYAYMYENREMQPKSFLSLLLTGMIYPTIYLIYLSTIPFSFEDYRINWEMYGNVKQAAYSVYGSATDTFSKPTSWAYILVMYLVFFPGSLALFYYSWKWINKLKVKN